MELIEPQGNSGDVIAIDSLPKSALQAIYHAVTGKTETLQKNIIGNVIITDGDFDRLHGMLLDQLDIHKKMINPTVTVVVKHSNEKSVTYSSWERFKILRLNHHEITSEIIFKLETVIQLPGTQQHQRLVVNINLDSALPVIKEHNEDEEATESLGFLIFIGKGWRAAKISIDFVDFVVAKSFVTVVEEWFATLKKTPVRRFNNLLLKNFNAIRAMVGQSGRLGMAAFLVAFVIFNNSAISLSLLTVGVAIGLVIWSIFVIVDFAVTKVIFKRLSSNIIPAVILLNDADRTSYAEIEDLMKSPTSTAIGFIMFVALSIIINVGSSYIYTYLTAK